MEKALRRHHIRRIKANQRRLGYCGLVSPTPKQVGMRLHTPCSCSCFMCGNPRKLGEVKIAELKADLSYDEWLSGY